MDDAIGTPSLKTNLSSEGVFGYNRNLVMYQEGFGDSGKCADVMLSIFSSLEVTILRALITGCFCDYDECHQENGNSRQNLTSAGRTPVSVCVRLRLR